MTKQVTWAKGRDNLVAALDADRSLTFCWRVLEHVAGAYASTNKIPFLALPAYERKAMRDWLAALEDGRAI